MNVMLSWVSANVVEPPRNVAASKLASCFSSASARSEVSTRILVSVECSRTLHQRHRDVDVYSFFRRNLHNYNVYPKQTSFSSTNKKLELFSIIFGVRLCKQRYWIKIRGAESRDARSDTQSLHLNKSLFNISLFALPFFSVGWRLGEPCRSRHREEKSV